MHSLLDRIFAKRGIKDTTELAPDEKKDFDRWSKILSQGEITLDKVMEFCRAQVAAIEGQFKNTENAQQKNDRLIQQYNVYKAILACMDAPKAEREALEKYLQSLLE